MKTDTIKGYKCEFCGVIFTDYEECKEHADNHFVINNIPITRQCYAFGKDMPTEIVVLGRRIRNNMLEQKKFIYRLAGEYDD